VSQQITTLGVKVVTKGAGKAKQEINSLGAAADKVKIAVGLMSAALVLGGTKAITAFKAQEQAVAKLNASIVSMNRVTPQLSSNLQQLASQIQRQGIIGDEALIEGASFLTTYSAISDDLLPRTMRIMSDFAAKMGGNTVQAANLLGKASMGLTGELSRLGITLSDEAKKTKDFNLILGEIETQVQGMNKALAATNTGKLTQVSNAFGDFQENIGKVLAANLAPVFVGLANGILDAKIELEGFNSQQLEIVDNTTSVANVLSILTDNFDKIISTLTNAGIAYGGLKLATYAQVTANNFLNKSNIITSKGVMGLGGVMTKTTLKTNLLTGSMRVLKAAMPFAWAFAALEAATWAFSKSTEESSAVIDKQTKFLKLYQESIEGVSEAKNKIAKATEQKITLDIDIDIQRILKKLQVAKIAYQEKLAEFSKQSPKTDATAGIFKEQIEMMKLTKIYRGAIIAKQQFLTKKNKKIDMTQHAAILKLTSLTDKLTKKKKEIDKITDAQIASEKILNNQYKNSAITLEQYTKGVNIMKNEIQKYNDTVEQIAFDKKMEKMAKKMEDSITDSIMKMSQGLGSFKDFASSIFRDMAAEMVRVQIAKPLASAGSAFLGKMMGSLSLFGAPSLSAPIMDLRPPTFAGSDIGFAANGGPVRSGDPYVVGEKGPELFIPNSSGTIIPNHVQGQPTAASNNTNVTVNYSPQVNALDPRTAAIVIAENAPTVVGIIRQAFNRNGQAVAI